MLTRCVSLRRRAPLRRGAPPRRRSRVRNKRSQPRRGPVRSPDYLAWIRTLECVVCSKVNSGSTVIEAAHTNALGPKGMSQKTSDFSAIPLCSGHHWQSPDSYHRLGEKHFARAHRLDLRELVRDLNHRFRSPDSATPHPVRWGALTPSPQQSSDTSSARAGRRPLR